MVTIAVLAVCALALYAAMDRVNTAGSGPPSAGEQAKRLIPHLATGSTSVDKLSSNPYDYAADNPTMDALVALGTPALAELEDCIAAAPDDGLNTFLMAIAAEKIARVDLREGSTADSAADSWETGRAWLPVWRTHLQAIPESVARISASDASQSEKTARLVALGTPAIPFILDRVAAGDLSLALAATELVRGTVEVQGVDMPTVVTRAWAKAEGASYGELRQMVDGQR